MVAKRMMPEAITNDGDENILQETEGAESDDIEEDADDEEDE
jgi:hypothetical protein